MTKKKQKQNFLKIYLFLFIFKKNNKTIKIESKNL